MICGRSEEADEYYLSKEKIALAQGVIAKTLQELGPNFDTMSWMEASWAKTVEVPSIQVQIQSLDECEGLNIIDIPTTSSHME